MERNMSILFFIKNNSCIRLTYIPYKVLLDANETGFMPIHYLTYGIAAPGYNFANQNALV